MLASLRWEEVSGIMLEYWLDLGFPCWDDAVQLRLRSNLMEMLIPPDFHDAEHEGCRSFAEEGLGTQLSFSQESPSRECDRGIPQ